MANSSARQGSFHTSTARPADEQYYTVYLGGKRGNGTLNLEISGRKGISTSRHSSGSTCSYLVPPLLCSVRHFGPRFACKPTLVSMPARARKHHLPVILSERIEAPNHLAPGVVLQELDPALQLPLVLLGPCRPTVDNLVHGAKNARLFRVKCDKLANSDVCQHGLPACDHIFGLG